MERCGTSHSELPLDIPENDDLVASGTSRSRPVIVRSRCGFQDLRARYRDVVNVVCCLNSGQEVLFPNSFETHLGLVSRRVFDLGRVDKHTLTTPPLPKNNPFKFFFPKTA